ncbi:MAG TPA: hypothetical protein VK588_16525, partial [Chitinophagaceae bacterium]|nr:hypothetical protein [Chitinophagaceae bacterium]
FLVTEGDTLTAPSSFVKSFFETFTPSDSLKGFDPYEKKSISFFKDFFSTDTLVHKRAAKAIDEVKLDSVDFPNLDRAIASENWSDKKYLTTKKSLVGKLGDLDTRASTDLLKKIYDSEGDTVEIQYVVLESLLQQQTQYAFNVFKDIIIADPPVLETNSDYSTNRYNMGRYNYNLRGLDKSSYDNGDFWDELYDSIKLTRTLLPGILPLVNLDDYKWKMMELLERMIDSNLVKPADYEIYFSKFFIEAKQEFRKQVINEKKALIKEASDENINPDGEDDDEGTDFGNRKLETYLKLILPFWNANANVPPFFQQILQSNDKKLKYSTMILMVQDKKPVPDSVLDYFAGMDEYRYTLYSDLKQTDQLKMFPQKYNNQAALARSKLINSKPYNKPDSVLYLDKIPAEFNSVQGFIYFFKYKEKKDDPVWRIATVGLLSKDPKKFEVREPSVPEYGNTDEDQYPNSNFDVTSFTDSKLLDDVPVSLQLNKELKKLLYARRKSAKEFYDIPKTNPDDITSFRSRN